MELEKLIHQHAEKLSELDRGILNFILSDPSLIQNLKITDLAERLYVSLRNWGFLVILSSNIFYDM